MAKIALVLVLSLALLLSIQCVAGDDALSPPPSAQGPSSSSAGASTDGDEASWIGWAEDQLRNKKLDALLTIDIIKTRIAIWAKEKWLSLNQSIVDLRRFIHCINVPHEGKRRSPPFISSAPPPGFLKFKVDGSSLEKPGLAGIGGILREHLGNELIRFSKHVGIVDSNEAELLAIREAFILFSTSRWIFVYSLIVESDSKNAVCCVNNSASSPRGLRYLVNHIEKTSSYL
ncbi:hypothetical protein PTKIN_Ptkin18bG0067300 [Pterospermum kingtungense]